MIGFNTVCVSSWRELMSALLPKADIARFLRIRKVAAKLRRFYSAFPTAVSICLQLGHSKVSSS